MPIRAIKDPGKLAAYAKLAALGDGADREIRIIEGL